MMKIVGTRRWFTIFTWGILTFTVGAGHDALAQPPSASTAATGKVTDPATLLTAMVNDTRLLPDPGGDAAALARTLKATHNVVASTTSSASRIAAAGRLEQLASRRLADHPDWLAPTLHALADPVRTRVDANVKAQLALRSIRSGRLSDLLPGWTIVKPAAARDLLSWYRQAGRANGIGWQYLAAINLVETRMGRIRGVSSAGARGPMQFLPSTWAGCCAGDIDDPRDAIFGAARYLRQRGGRSDIDKALFGYNPSAGYVTAVKAYASVLASQPSAFYAYCAWQVYVSTTAGDVRLPTGYSGTTHRPPAADYLAANPQDRAP